MILSCSVFSHSYPPRWCGVLICLPSCLDPTPFLPFPKPRGLCTALESWGKAETGGGKGRAKGTGWDLCLLSPLTHSAASQHVEFSTPGGPPTQFPPKPPPFPSFCPPASSPSSYPSLLRGGGASGGGKGTGICHGVGRGLGRG